MNYKLILFFSTTFLLFKIPIVVAAPEFTLELIKKTDLLNTTDDEDPIIATGPIPPELLFKIIQSSKHTLSPDGDFLASVERFPDKNILAILDIENHKVITSLDLGLKYPKNLRWKDDKLLVEINSNIFEVARGNSKPRNILGYDDKPKNRIYFYMNWSIISVLSDNPESILVAGKDAFGLNHRVYTYNLYTGELEENFKIPKKPSATWYFDKKGTLRVGINKTKDAFNIYERIKGKIKKIDSIPLNNEYRFLNHNNTFLSNRVSMEGTGKDPDILHIAHNLNSDLYKTYEYSISKRKFIKPIFWSNKHDMGGYQSGSYIRYNVDKSIVGFTYIDDRIETQWVNEKLKELQFRIDQKFPDNNNSILDFNKKLNSVLFSSTKNKRGLIYLYQEKNDKFQLISNRSSELDSYELSHEKSIRYVTKDGTKHLAYISQPTNTRKKPNPTIVMLSEKQWHSAYLEFSP